MTKLTVPRISLFPWNKSNIFIRKLTGEGFCNLVRVITQSMPLSAPMHDENIVELIGNFPLNANSSRSQQFAVHCAAHSRGLFTRSLLTVHCCHGHSLARHHARSKRTSIASSSSRTGHRPRSPSTSRITSNSDTHCTGHRARCTLHSALLITNDQRGRFLPYNKQHHANALLHHVDMSPLSHASFNATFETATIFFCF